MSRARDMGAALRICFDGAKAVAVVVKDLEERRHELQKVYAGIHEGALPPKQLRAMLAPSPFRGDLVELGALVSVTYRTIKGKGKHGSTKERYLDWEHEFGDNPKKLLPVIATTASGEGLVILGGDFHVGPRGIVG